ncbi:hypothetical protein B0O80DRAFT_499993 [Mortierella sp. GBAus27b]|nr:hypothetical protein B0O80DRAFT_499993 [Mortierella sp. GBAus27b]
MTMNIEDRESLSALVLRKSGELGLDPAQVKSRTSNTNVKIAYEQLAIQLQRKHAQIRYSSTQLIAEFFQRSHVFRELLVADYSVFLQLTKKYEKAAAEMNEVADSIQENIRNMLTIQVNKDNPVDVTETEENSELYATLCESYPLNVKKDWPIVTEWLDALMKVDHGGEQRAEYDRLLKFAIDLKRGVADAKSKSEDLGINMETMYGLDEHDSDEEDKEFEVVDTRAPVVPWDDDLAMWDKKEVAFNASGLEYSHRFLDVGDGSNMVSQATLDQMRMRTRVYSSQLPKVIRACRYLMSNGRLCMTRDVVRCPYHGPIVPRDERGQSVKSSIWVDDAQFKTRVMKDKSTWEDIDDVNLALDLEKIESKRQGAESSKRKRAQKPTLALINISKPAETSKTRLLKHLGTKAVKDAGEQDPRSA